jgi:hypothetical protein
LLDKDFHAPRAPLTQLVADPESLNRALRTRQRCIALFAELFAAQQRLKHLHFRRDKRVRAARDYYYYGLCSASAHVAAVGRGHGPEAASQIFQ